MAITKMVSSRTLSHGDAISDVTVMSHAIRMSHGIAMWQWSTTSYLSLVCLSVFSTWFVKNQRFIRERTGRTKKNRLELNFFANNFFSIGWLILTIELVMRILNDTHSERLVFHSIQYWNGWLAASDIFDMFTQSINFYTFYYQYICDNEKCDSSNRQ